MPVKVDVHQIQKIIEVLDELPAQYQPTLEEAIADALARDEALTAIYALVDTLPSKEEADVILRNHGFNPDEIGKHFASVAKQVLDDPDNLVISWRDQDG